MVSMETRPVPYIARYMRKGRGAGARGSKNSV
jgi:hypothetical protein